MLSVNARLPFISVDVWYMRSPNQYSCLTVGHYFSVASRDSWPDSDLHLFTIETEQDWTRLTFIQYTQFHVNWLAVGKVLI